MLINRVSSQQTFQSRNKFNQASFEENKQTKITTPEVATAAGTTIVGAEIGKISSGRILALYNKIFRKQLQLPEVTSTRAAATKKVKILASQIVKLKDEYAKAPTVALKNEIDAAERVLKNIIPDTIVKKLELVPVEAGAKKVKFLTHSKVGAAIGALAALTACAITKLATSKTAVEPE